MSGMFLSCYARSCTAGIAILTLFLIHRLRDSRRSWHASSLIIANRTDAVVDLVGDLLQFCLELCQAVDHVIVGASADGIGFGTRLHKNLFGATLCFQYDHVFSDKLIGFLAGDFKRA